ncbi:hypothetical protein [Pseudonocardia sp. ICBG601]|uniref:hypothetical protein n=1 Tax=Pseudonocardia sp. ICBG601 TaxID=2846759 RepID=UPI0027E36364|nr:hypothetical protein [Pseudonocardia sp. ICBG601]
MTTTDNERAEQLEAAGLGGQNRLALGRLLGSGTIGYAEEGPDGVLRATIRIPEDEICYEPGILILRTAVTSS